MTAERKAAQEGGMATKAIRLSPWDKPTEIRDLEVTCSGRCGKTTTARAVFENGAAHPKYAVSWVCGGCLNRRQRRPAP